MAKQPTIDTCVLSGKPIRQKHLDDKLVIDYGKGRAFVSAVENTIKEPPDNPVVFSTQDVSTVALTYTRHNFPARIQVKGRLYKNFPEFIYIQNQMFKLSSHRVIHQFDRPKDLVDGKYEVGLVLYQRTKERPEIKVDKPEKK